jgi:hypothetical protein
MKNRIIIILSIFLSGCAATSPYSMREEPPSAQYQSRKSVMALKNCLAPPIESYPVLAGFSFEDRTLPVVVREINGDLSLYQQQGVYMMTMIEAKNTGEAREVSLRVSPTHIKAGVIERDYKRIIESCI